MKRFLLVIAAVAAVGAAALGTFTLAGEASAAGVDLSGRGVLYARGAGVAEVKGDGWVDIRGHGLGTVIVSGAEHLTARGEGRRVELPDGSVKFVGWKGTIHADGRDITVAMRGGKIEFRAAGDGEAFLKGHGVYRVGHQKGVWMTAGITVGF